MKKVHIFILFLLLVLLSTPLTSAHSLTDILPKGRLQITGFDAPDIADAGTPFTTNVTIQNRRFLPVNIMIRVDALDGVLSLLEKDIGDTQLFRIPGRSTTTIEISCTLRKGDIVWYKGEYNLQAVLLQQLPILGLTTRDTSTIRGVHINTPQYEQTKLTIKEVTVPEVLTEGQHTFTVELLIQNQGAFDTTAWTRVDLVEKPAIFPELDQYISLRGLGSEVKELGRSKEHLIKTGETTRFTVPCMIRRTEQDKTEFVIEALVFVNQSGVSQQVAATTLYGIRQEQSFLTQYGFWIIIGIFGALTAILIIVFIIRILYPAYYIKKDKLGREKQRLEKKHRH